MYDSTLVQTPDTLVLDQLPKLDKKRQRAHFSIVKRQTREPTSSRFIITCCGSVQIATTDAIKSHTHWMLGKMFEIRSKENAIESPLMTGRVQSTDFSTYSHHICVGFHWFHKNETVIFLNKMHIFPFGYLSLAVDDRQINVSHH